MYFEKYKLILQLPRPKCAQGVGRTRKCSNLLELCYIIMVISTAFNNSQTSSNDLVKRGSDVATIQGFQETDICGCALNILPEYLKACPLTALAGLNSSLADKSLIPNIRSWCYKYSALSTFLKHCDLVGDVINYQVTVAYCRSKSVLFHRTTMTLIHIGR